MGTAHATIPRPAKPAIQRRPVQVRATFLRLPRPGQRIAHAA